MAKLIMTMGLPGSGKTTWALDKIATSPFPDVWERVNKDDIRAEFERAGWKWSREAEGDVIKVRDARISQALKNGLNVISDDTNFAWKHKKRLQELAEMWGAEFERKSFEGIPLEECIRRDGLRPRPVGEGVIRKMWSQYLAPAQEVMVAAKVEWVQGLRPAIICDLDGTLADFKTQGLRGPYDATKCDQDLCVKPIRTLIGAMRAIRREIIYLSGREDKFREPTRAFLSAHHCPDGDLFMRKTGDSRKDSIVKLELFDWHVRGKWNVEFVLDDRDQVVKMWREIGLTCLQVAEGAF